MRILVAGGTGAIGRLLVPQLVGLGHEVIAVTRNPGKAKDVEALGAKAAVADALDREELTAAVKQAGPEVIISQLTSIPGAANFKRLDEDFALTNRLRTEATDTLLEATRLVGARRFISQSFCGWPFARVGGPIKDEFAPLDPEPPSSFRQTLAAIRHLEERVKKAEGFEALALRYGFFYGPNTNIAHDGEIVAAVRARRLPVVGSGAGVWSFIHVYDAAAATAAAVSSGMPGIYNIVDDEPAPVSAWLPALARAVGAKPPYRVPAWLVKPLIGEGGVAMMTQIRGATNAKAKRELNWALRYSSWRRGFVEGLG